MITTLISDHIRQRTGRIVEVEQDHHLFEDLGLDSLDRVTICFAIEEHYHIPDIDEGSVFYVRDLMAFVPESVG